LYTAFMIYAGGMKFLLLSALLYVPGTALYFWARREQNRQLFTPVEWVVLLVAVVGAVIGIHGLVTGYITI
jgi:arginine:ornithine antiporter / lysine permease